MPNTHLINSIGSGLVRQSLQQMIHKSNLKVIRGGGHSKLFEIGYIIKVVTRQERTPLAAE